MNINRPISPHLTIYNLGITSTLSIFHRVTGGALSVALCAIVILLKIFSFHLSSYSIYAVAYFINSFSSIIFLFVGFLMLFAIIYHFFGGIRHLVWDAAIGLEMEYINLSAYLLLGCTVVLTLIIWLIF